MVMSGADKAIYAYRNGNPIGRARVEICGRGALGDHVFSVLEATTGRMSSLVPGRQARRWMSCRRREDRVAPADESGVCGESLSNDRAGEDGHHHRSAGHAQPPQRSDPRKLTRHRSGRRSNDRNAGLLPIAILQNVVGV
jgi:hypothetical protein